MDDVPVIPNIEDLITAAVRELDQNVPRHLSIVPLQRQMAFAQLLRRADSAAAALQNALCEDTSFGNLRSGWIRVGGEGQVVQNHMLPSHVVHTASAGKEPRDILSYLKVLARSETSASEIYAPIVGITISEPVELADSAELVPWDHVPECDQKERFGREALTLEGISPMRPLPTAAIRMRRPESRILFASHNDAEQYYSDQTQDQFADWNRENDVFVAAASDTLRCITILSRSPAAMLGSWTFINEPGARAIMGSAYSYTESVFDQRLLSVSHNPVALNGVELTDTLRSFRALSQSDREALTVATDRIAASLKRPTMVDRAIDLGIGLEAILLHGIGDGSDRGELRFRAAIRGAAFLGGTTDERRHIFKVIRSAYDLRSAAVHSGRLDARKLPADQQTLEEGTRIFCELAKKLLQAGSFPDWDRDFVLLGH